MSSRKSSIASLLIMTAGLAGSLGLLRLVAAGITPGELWDAIVRPGNGWSVHYAFELCLELGPFLGVPLLAGWTPACLALTLLSPRPRWRRLVREPGFIGCLLVTVTVVLTLGITAACMALSWLEYQGRPAIFIIPILLCGCLAGAAVLGSWATMLLTRTWRPNASWTDRLGRLTGVAWVVLAGLCTPYITLAIR